MVSRNMACGGSPPRKAPQSASARIPFCISRCFFCPAPKNARGRGPEKAARRAAPGPGREERSPKPAQCDQPTEGRGRAGRGRGRPGGTRRGEGAEGPEANPQRRGGRTARSTRSSPRASRRTECLRRPSRPRRGRSEASGGPGRRRSDGRAQAATAQGQRSRGPGSPAEWCRPQAAGRSPGAAAGRRLGRAASEAGPTGGSRCAGGRWVPAYLLMSRRRPVRAEYGT